MSPPALTFDLIFILELLLFDIDIERLRIVLGFEADERRSPVQAGTRGQITHAPEIFLLRRRYDDCEVNLALMWVSSKTNGEDLLMVRPSRWKMMSEEE